MKLITMGKQEVQRTISRRQIAEQTQAYLDSGGEIEVLESSTDVNYHQQIVTMEY